MSQDVTYCYDGSFEGFLCCIFESYRNKEVPTAICCDEDFAPTLFAVRAVTTDPDHARRVLRKLIICSPVCANLVRRGFLTYLPEKELYLYRLVAKLLREGPGFLQNFSDETLHPVAKAVQHLNSEAHLLKGFVRFSELGGVLGGEIAPKNRVLPLLRSHFCARYLNESFFLYDRTHKEALFYAGGRAVIRPLEEFQMAPPDETEAKYRLLWKRFYDTIAIRERENPRCRMSNMPKRYWGTMTEFQDASYFTPQSSPAAVSAPGAPDGRSALGIPPAPGPSAPGSSP
ncbi:TIGR03915 family putative DNA repair protein [Dysosmobacter sp.]|uniref:TIGR03915 family putative DNA repair protein n=1 Tax=Dysosmobacter sp. TaxID=2591382 RepID=UPI0026123561|nr:TIGR03915 family putative DNA repair protein [Dysosmobacter sp.]